MILISIRPYLINLNIRARIVFGSQNVSGMVDIIGIVCCSIRRNFERIIKVWQHISIGRLCLFEIVPGIGIKSPTIICFLTFNCNHAIIISSKGDCLTIFVKNRMLISIKQYKYRSGKFLCHITSFIFEKLNQVNVSLTMHHVCIFCSFLDYIFVAFHLCYIFEVNCCWARCGKLVNDNSRPICNYNLCRIGNCICHCIPRHIPGYTRARSRCYGSQNNAKVFDSIRHCQRLTAIENLSARI